MWKRCRKSVLLTVLLAFDEWKIPSPQIHSHIPQMMINYHWYYLMRRHFSQGLQTWLFTSVREMQNIISHLSSSGEFSHQTEIATFWYLLLNANQWQLNQQTVTYIGNGSLIKNHHQKIKKKYCVTLMTQSKHWRIDSFQELYLMWSLTLASMLLF